MNISNSSSAEDDVEEIVDIVIDEYQITSFTKSLQNNSRKYSAAHGLTL